MDWHKLTGFLGAKAVLAVAEGFVREYAQEVTIEDLRACRDEGRTFLELSPHLRHFLETTAGHNSDVLEDLKFRQFLAWAEGGNPALIQALVQDPELMGWAARTWREGVAEVLAQRAALKASS